MTQDLIAIKENSGTHLELKRIVRQCVHCGFCNATCPTFELLGDELDGPRGRIYQIKGMLEGIEPTLVNQKHLDSCLNCRNCETTCPSGVKYTQILKSGLDLIEKNVPRSFAEKVLRYLVILIIPNRILFKFLFFLGCSFRSLLPDFLKKKIVIPVSKGKWPKKKNSRTMVLVQACGQNSATPNVNAAAARVLSRLGIDIILVKTDGCCGAIPLHLNNASLAKKWAKKNIDIWLDCLANGSEAIVSTASGCGLQIKEYKQLLIDDPDYREKAELISSKCFDLVQIVEKEDLKNLNIKVVKNLVAFHSPCTLQHGQKLEGSIEKILVKLGFKLSIVGDPHMCCGSAGTYSLFQPKIAEALKQKKIGNLMLGDPSCIVTANVGCQLHLASESVIPVNHWIELIDNALDG